MSSAWEQFKRIIGLSPVSIGDLNKAAVKTPAATKPEYDAEPPIEVTAEYRRILDYVNAKAPVVFVTGKAGTGKSTLIRFIRDQIKENCVVVAPTGVAALQVGGATIHSFFRFPHHLIRPEDIQSVRDRHLYRKIQLLIIDEVSMVRSDVIDAIDLFLRKNRESEIPFAGVPLMMVGDLFQLPPVASKEENEALRLLRYDSQYFFSAKAFQKADMVSVELTKIYRQTDDNFIRILNRVRIGESSPDVLGTLNGRYPAEDFEDFRPPYVTLTPTNRAADAINDAKLKALPEPEKVYSGEIIGKFQVDRERLPSPTNLALRVGAQIMFTKNDSNRRWVNGTVGSVVELNHDSVRVMISRHGQETIHDVGRVTWKSYKYGYDSNEDRIRVDEAGEYRQIPLMPAWAVTIHKSQGKTLDKILLDLGDGAFENGQVYVALSRCRSLKSIYLRKPIRPVDVKCDPTILRFHAALERANCKEE